MKNVKIAISCALLLTMLVGTLTGCGLVRLPLPDFSGDGNKDSVESESRGSENDDLYKDWEKEERPDRDNENEDGEIDSESKNEESKNEESETNNESGNAQVKYVYFGEYPQTIKADGVTVGTDADSRGYYLGSDGSYYAKVTANPQNTGYTYTFSTGATVSSGTEYYFKVEPIRWRILSEDGDTALILCDSIIAAEAYDSENEDNNYADSGIRAWLNDTFYETAFTELERELIVTSTVDNGAASTGEASNQYACEDTEDKIFLLSYADAINSSYGFSSGHETKDETRQMLTSDYARATGVFMTHSGDYLGYGYWWLRSPRPDDSGKAHIILDNGSVSSYSYGGSAWLEMMGVVPAMQVRLTGLNVNN